jgi:hypothetical protein
MGRWQRNLLILGCFFVGGLIGFWIWYANWVHFIENYELGFTFDRRTGQIETLKHTGWVVRTPWLYDVHAIDLRPSQVCMNANQRVLNCKLVQFDQKGMAKFVEWHGRAAGDGDYVYEILKSYAFNVNEGRDCPFLIVLDEMRKKPDAASQTTTALPQR